MSWIGDLFAQDETPDAGAMPDFVEAIEDVGRVRIARLRGRVGKEIGAEVEEVQEAAEEEPGALSRHLLLDFRGTEGADSSTVAYLVRSLRARMPTGAKVGILHPPKELIAELEIARLDDLFPVFESEEEALKRLK